MNELWTRLTVLRHRAEAMLYRYNPDQPRVPAGGPGGGEFQGDGSGGKSGGDKGGKKKDKDKVRKAIASFKPSTAAKQDKATESEHEVSKLVGGTNTGDNAPVDTTVRIGGRLHGVEVKTFVDNTHDKVTMHPKSQARKERWARKNGATLHTVVLDKRPASQHSGHNLYYRRGVGSFRLHTMTRVRDGAHLKSLMRGK